jgi:hypothetical protein
MNKIPNPHFSISISSVRARTNHASQKAIPKNTATLAYFSGKASTETSSADDIESWPSSASSSPKPTADTGAEQSPSPTPSDIVLAAHLDDTLALGEENRQMVEKRVGSGKRKKVLREKEKERESRREDERNQKEYEKEQREYEEEQESISRHEEGKKGK